MPELLFSATVNGPPETEGAKIVAKYVFAYQGGSQPETEEEGQRVMAQWMGWFETLGSAVVDMGNPFGASATVGSDGSTSDGAGSGLSGYSVVTADSLEQAAKMASSCPIFGNGGGVDVYEALEM